MLKNKLAHWETSVNKCPRRRKGKLKDEDDEDINRYVNTTNRY